MGLPVTIYRSTDPGAPQIINSTPSEWVDILKKVLVDGYGTKSPLGWTLEFEDAGAYKVAFRNNLADGGSGGYVQFWSHNGTNGANIPMNMKAAMGMGGLDDFIKPLPGRQLYNNGVKAWEIIGTSRGFYIAGYSLPLTVAISNSSSNSAPNQYFIGDIESFTPNDAAVFTMASCGASNGDIYSSTSYGICANSEYIFAFMYDADGGAAGYRYEAHKSYLYQSTAMDGDAEGLGINHHMLPLMLRISVTADVTSSNDSLARPVVRGKLPGLFESSFAGYRTEDWPKEITQDGVTWSLLRAYYATRFWIKTGTWYD